ncbi:MAG TPA: transporter substrate-binding domain-containing protein [Stellaceae bacterium]|jgi:polar amino acid transport system substrate-binding protein|nr:transporter substrate-binding domain-containing protein [Stellaceae bacterium]
MLSRRLFAGAAAAGTATLLAERVQAQAQAPAPVNAVSGDSTIDRVKNSKTLRIAALPGEAPYFNKDLASGEWTGMCIDMAKDIAKVFDGKVEYLESTYGNSVLDLQAGKIDLAFSLNPTPLRALVIDFTHAFYLHGFGMVGKKGFKATNWAELNKPEVKIAVDIGSVHEISARRFAPKATIIGFKMRDECILAVQSGRADCVILAVNLGLTAVKKNPQLGEFQMLHQPRVQLPTCMGIRMETDKRWRDFLNAWVDYNRGIQQIREWLYNGLAINGVKPEDVPADVEF